MSPGLLHALLHDLGEDLAARTMGTMAAPRSEIELDGVSEPHTLIVIEVMVSVAVRAWA
jgi:hypothetical protein